MHACPADLHRGHEAQTRTLHAAQKELAAQHRQHLELQAAHAELQEQASRLRVSECSKGFPLELVCPACHDADVPFLLVPAG